MEKELFVVTLTIFNTKTNEEKNFDYYFLSYDNAIKKYKLLKSDCDLFVTFAGDWKYNNVNIRRKRVEDSQTAQAGERQLIAHK